MSGVGNNPNQTYSKDYIITSISSSLTQRTFTNGASRTPFILAYNGRIALRNTCQAYVCFPGGQVPSSVLSGCKPVIPTDQSLSLPAFMGSLIGDITFT